MFFLHSSLIKDSRPLRYKNIEQRLNNNKLLQKARSQIGHLFKKPLSLYLQ